MNIMERQFITTDETLQSVGYEITKKVLEVEMCGGDVYAYEGVPYPVYCSLMTARSRNTFFQKKIRNSYPNRKVPALTADPLVPYA
jgi:hypothetical protein